ncbi:MAG: hypothetical protein A2Z19_06115 [Deltaproteobacteria bacterium RBG_16_54_18]|nr:MAG: hypothetical protein A2Z19_06115 [Deltaproteobacteria bacterium RBG_16_54_18]
MLIDCFNRMGCDAVGIGIGEFRLGAKDFIALHRKVQFPFLSAIVTLLEGQQGPLQTKRKKSRQSFWN